MRMQGNVALKMREETITSNDDERIYKKSGEILFDIGKDIFRSKTIGYSEDGALFNVLPAHEHLLTKLEKAKEKYKNDGRFGICINLA